MTMCITRMEPCWARKKATLSSMTPAIFVDDNGRVYLVSGFCPIPGINPRFAAMHLVTKGCQLIELADDMCTVREAPQIVLPQQADAEGTEFAEHPFF